MRQDMRVLRLRNLVGISLLPAEAIYVGGWTYKSIVSLAIKEKVATLVWFLCSLDRLCY